MPTTDFHDASSSISSSFAFLSRRRDQVHSMESPLEGPAQETDLEAFQRHVAERFQDLAAADSDELISIQWIRKLLDSFLASQEEFRVIVLNNKDCLNMAPMDKYISEFFERSVKALDVCNAIRDGIDQMRQWQKLLEIVLCALDNQRSIGEGQFRRAKKALVDLAIGMFDEKDSTTSFAHRNRSFCRNNVPKEQVSFAYFRSLSCSVSRSWSAARQLQAISNNLVAPKASETLSTNGLNVAVFTMNYVLLFVMWALVAAIPCQDRGLHNHVTAPRNFLWATPIHSLYERILDNSKKRSRRNSCGLLKEIHEIKGRARVVNDLIDTVCFPMAEGKEREVRQRIQDLGLVYETVKDGLDPLERQVREVFHRIVRSRTEGLDSTGQANTHRMEL